MKQKYSELYALLDIDTLKKYEKTIEWFVLRATKLNAKLIQYRDKSENLETMKQNIKKIKNLCDIPTIVNDNIFLVQYCDGLHLGQDDILKFGHDIDEAALFVRDEIGDKIFGLSTHDEKEILKSNELCVDYIGLGSYRQTDTKNVSNILGEKVDKLALLSNKDVAIIGGVKLTDNFKNAKYKVIGSNLYEN